MKKTINKYINIESFNTINNYPSHNQFITVNRLGQKNDYNKTMINQRRNNIISEDNFVIRPFIYKKKQKLIKSNSFYIKNRRNLSLRNDKSISLVKEKNKNNLILIPSYKHFDLSKNFNNSTNKKNQRKNKKPESKCRLNFSRNNNKCNYNTKDSYNKNSLNNTRYSQYKTKINNSNSIGLSLGSYTTKNSNVRKYNCYSFDDDITINDEQSKRIYYNNDIKKESSIPHYLNNKKEKDNKTNKYIKHIEKENEILKNELIKTNKKLNLLEKKIENIIEGKIFRSNTKTIIADAKVRLPAYKKNNIIKKCPIPTPYVQKFNKNDFFSIKKKDIKVTLKIKNKLKKEECKNNY